MRAKDYAVPVALIVVGALALLLDAYRDVEASHLLRYILLLGIGTVIEVALGVVACYVTARLMDTSFGYLGSATLKLAGILTFTSGVSALTGMLGWLLAILAYLGLLMWLFDLDALEAIVYAFVLWVVRIVVVMGVMVVLAGLIGAL
jgi:hypothetical protein